LIWTWAKGLCVFLLAAQTAAAEIVYYPVEPGRQIETEMPYQVLRLALEKHEKDWTLAPTPLGQMNEQRSKIALKKGEKLHVGWYGTHPELEKTLRPVRIPINGGLLGWRLLLIDRRRQDEFSKIETLDDLRQLRFLQGRGWGDVKVFESAGIEVVEDEYSFLFDQVAVGRGDAFPRGIDEAPGEHAAWSPSVPNLAIEQSLALYYPWMKLFFVHKDNKDLHDAIYDGLAKAHADGSFHELFLNHPNNREALALARLDKRRVIHIDHDFISEETKAIDQKYFYKITEGGTF